TQYNVIYGSPPGRVALRARYGTGPYISHDWDGRRGAFADRMAARLAELDAEFREVVAYEHVATPLDFWRANPAATHGNPIGGDFVGGQWLLDRLPYRTPVRGLYLSNS